MYEKNSTKGNKHFTKKVITVQVLAALGLIYTGSAVACLSDYEAAYTNTFHDGTCIQRIEEMDDKGPALTSHVKEIKATGLLTIENTSGIGIDVLGGKNFDKHRLYKAINLENITIDAKGGNGINSTSNGEINISGDATITTHGANYYGLYFSNGSGTTIGGKATITTNGANAYGINSFHGGNVTVTGKTIISTKGHGAHGVNARGMNGSGISSAVTLGDDAEITVKDDHSNGVNSDDTGSVTVGKRAHITATGLYSNGLNADNGSVIVGDDAWITTTGLFSNGLNADNGSVILGDNAHITATGLSSNGANSKNSGSVTVGNRAQITIDGAYSNGLNADNGNIVVGTGAIIKATGDYSNGIFASNYGNVTAGRLSITVGGGYGVLAQGGTVVFDDHGGLVQINNNNNSSMKISNGGTIQFANSVGANNLSLLLDQGTFDISKSTLKTFSIGSINRGVTTNPATIQLGDNYLSLGADNSSSDLRKTSFEGKGGLIKKGIGIVSFSGKDGWVGDTTINGGTFELANGGYLGGTQNKRVATTIHINDLGSVFALDNGASLADGSHIQGTPGGLFTMGNDFNGDIKTVATDIAPNTTWTLSNSSDVGNLTGAGTIDLRNNILSVTTNDTINSHDGYSGKIKGSGSLVKTGTDTFTLSNAKNDYKGGTTINEGTLILTDVKAAGTGNIVIGLNNDKTSLTFKLSKPGLYNHIISGLGKLVLESGNLVLAGVNTYGGGTTVNDQSSLTLTNVGNAGSGDMDNNGTLNFWLTQTTGSGIYSHVISGLGKVILTQGDLTLSGNNSYNGGTTVKRNTSLTLTNVNASGSGAMANDGSLTFDLNNTNSDTYANRISGTGKLTLASGNLTLGGDNNSYSGGTTIDEKASLTLTNVNASGTGAMTDDGSLIFDLTNTNSGAYTNKISGTGDVTINSGNLILDDSGREEDINSYSGGTTIGKQASLQLDSDTAAGTGVITNNSTLINKPSGLYLNFTGDLANNISGAGTNTIVNGADVGLSGDNSGASGDWLIKGTARINETAHDNGTDDSHTRFGSGIVDLDKSKKGAGTLSLSSANNYTFDNTLKGNGVFSVDLVSTIDDVTHMPDHQFHFSNKVGSDFTGTVNLSHASIHLGDPNNKTALKNSTLSLGEGGYGVTLGDPTYVNSLAFNGGVLRINNEDGLVTGPLVTVGTLDVTNANGTIQFNVPISYKTPTSSSADSLGTLFDQNYASMQLIYADKVTGRLQQITLTDLNGQSLANSSDLKVYDSYQNSAIATYDLTGHYGKHGISVRYGLKQLALSGTEEAAFALTNIGATNNDFDAKITGLGDLILEAVGNPIILSNSDNDYSGATSLNKGQLTFGNNHVLGDTSGLTINTTVDMNSYTQTLGALTLANSGKLLLNGGRLVLDNTMGTGAFAMDAGSTINFGTQDNLGVLTLAAGGEAKGALIGQGTLNIAGGDFIITHDNGTLLNSTFNVIDAHTLISDNANGLGTGTINLQDRGSNLSVGTGTLNNLISGVGSVTKTGNGDLTLGGDNNSYSGGTTIDEGTLTLTDVHASGTGAMAITDNSSLVFDLTPDQVSTDQESYRSTILGTGDVTIVSGNLILDDSNQIDKNSYTGGTTIGENASLQLVSVTGAGTGVIVNNSKVINSLSGLYLNFKGDLTNNISGNGANTIVSGADVILLGNNSSASGNWLINGMAQTTSAKSSVSFGLGAIDLETMNEGRSSAGTLSLTTPNDYTFDNKLLGDGVLTVDLDGISNITPDHYFSFNETVGAGFKGRVNLNNAAINLDDANNRFALSNSTLSLSTGGFGVTNGNVPGNSYTLNSLAFNGGVLRITNDTDGFATGPLVKVHKLDLMDVNASGTIQFNLPATYHIPTPPSIDSTDTLFDQDDANGSFASVRLISADSVSGQSITNQQITLTDLKGNLLNDGNTDITVYDGDGNQAQATYNLYGQYDLQGISMHYGLTQLALSGTEGTAFALTNENATNNDFGAKIVGIGDLILKAVDKSIILSNSNNNYEGGTYLNSGTLILGNDNVLGNTSGLTISDQTIADINGKSQTLGALHLISSGNLLLNGGKLTLVNDSVKTGAFTMDADSTIDFGTLGHLGELTLATGGIANGTLTGQGTLNIVGGDFIITHDNGAALNSTLNVTDAHSLISADANGLGIGDINLQDSGSNLSVGAGTLSNTINGGGTMTKTDNSAVNDNILTLTGTTGWTGQTFIEGGTLALDGSSLSNNSAAAQLTSNIVASQDTALNLNNGAGLIGSVTDDSSSSAGTSGHLSMALDKLSSWTMTAESYVNSMLNEGSVNVTQDALHVTNDYTNSGTLTIDGSSKVSVGGALTLSDNSAVNLTIDPNNPTITADSATLAGNINITGFGNALTSAPMSTSSINCTGCGFTIIHTTGNTPINGDIAANTTDGSGNSVFDLTSASYLLAQGGHSADNMDYNVGFQLAWDHGGDALGTGLFDMATGTAFNLDQPLNNQEPLVTYASGWDGKSLTKAGDGLLIMSVANNYTGTTTVAGGTLRTDADNVLTQSDQIIINGGTFSFNDHNQTLNQLQGNGGVIDLGLGTLTANNSSDSLYHGEIRGQGDFTKIGGGNLTLMGQSNWTGQTNITEGTLTLDGSDGYGQLSGKIVGQMGAAFVLNHGASFTGTVDPLDMTLTTSNDTWNMTDNSAVHNLTNNGQINFTNTEPGRVLTVNGNYSGNNGLIAMNTTLNDDNSATDKLVVKGDTSGQTGIIINNVRGAGAQTTNGIQLVEVDGLSNGNFTLANRVVAGAYDYGLAKDGNGNWALQSSATVRPGVAVYNANRQVATTMFTQDMNTRLDSPLFNAPAPTPTSTLASTTVPSASSVGGATPDQGNMRMNFLVTPLSLTESNNTGKWNNSWGYNSWGIATGSRTKSRTMDESYDRTTTSSIVQVGTDFLYVADAEGRFHSGVMFSAGSGKSDTNTGNIDASVMYHPTAHSTVKGYSVGLYGTWYSNPGSNLDGLYVDSWLQYGWYRDEMDSDSLSKVTYNSRALMGSLETGYAKLVYSNTPNNLWYIEPQAQLVFNHYTQDDIVEDNGTHIQVGNSTNFQTRLGINTFGRILTTNYRIQPSLALNWWHRQHVNILKLDDTEVESGIPTNRYEVKLGLDIQFNQAWSINGSIAGDVGQNHYSSIQGQLGVNYQF